MSRIGATPLFSLRLLKWLSTLVYTESGRGIDKVMIDGRIVMQDRRVTTIDEDALHREVDSLMKHFHRRI